MRCQRTSSKGVSERTGGVPLFVEEVTRLLLERGEPRGAQAIPPTLQQSLAARLDRLGSARETAQIGAVLGRGFSYALLQSVAGLDEGALRSALERLAEADILFVEGDGAQASYRFKHALIQDAAYDSLLKSSRQALHAQAAEILSQSASPEPEAIAHHFTQAGLDDLAIEWWGKAGDQALRRSAFQEAIAHLGKAIAMADKTGARARRSIGGAAVPNQRLTQLYVAHGNALIAARGFGAAETAEAFAKARESAAGGKDAPERLAAEYGLWAGNFVRGELPSMRAHASAFLSDVEARPDSPEAGVAHRAAGITCWVAGEYREARDHLERALGLFQPGRDDDLAFRFGPDPGVLAMHYLALTLWPMGDIGRAVSLVGRAEARIADLTHVGTLAPGRMHAAIFDLMRGDRARVAANAFELTRLAREFDLNLFRAFSVFLEGWASTASGSRLEGMRRGVELLREQNVLWFDGLLKMALAQAEAQGGDPGRAVAILDETLVTCDRTGYRAFDAELYRVRGEMLLKRDPANPAPAEEAFLTAIAVSRQQGARSFNLRAALSLAKLCQSTARPTDAHAALTTALEGFSATLEMPEIAEAAALLAALAEIHEVKAAEAQRRRRLHLQTAYGQAMMWAKGFVADETQAAFSRATELTAKSDDFAERFAAAHFQWTRAFLRGELRSARELESSFLKEAEDMGRVVEAGVARRGLALACYQAGDFQEARIHCERALEACGPDQERETQERFHDATGPVVMSVLAVTMWQLGEPERARELIDQAAQRARDLGHGPSMTHPLLWRSHLEILRGDAAAALPPAEALADLGLERGMPFWRTAGEMSAGWARGRLRDAEGGAADLRRALAERATQGGSVDAWLHTVLLAELEAKTLGAQRALERNEEAMALVRQLENRCNLSFPHLLRAELLLKSDPPSPAGAEEAFQSAISIATDQGARSWGLRAALALAKLYHSTGRPVEAHAVLAPALEGFVPTPEFPEIGEAQALLAALAATDELKAEAAHRQRLTQLHVSYGNALIAARGYGAPETTEAFARARESTAGDKDAPGRLSADYGLWVGSFTRGELPSMRAHSSDLLNDVQTRPNSPEAGVAHRVAGATCWFAGDYREARDHLERALALFQPGRDDDMAFRFGQDQGVSAMAYLALVLWPLGEIDRAASFMSRALVRMASLTHGNTIALGHMFAAQFALMHGGPVRGKANSLELARIASAHDLTQFRAFGMFFDGWARVETDLLGGLDGMRRGVDSLRAQNILIFDGLVKIALARTEAEAGDPGRAAAILDEALATAERPGHRTFEAELHRARGEILLKQNPAIPAPAEDAFLTAIAVAKQQGARSFELRGALALARLYRSIGHPGEAHAVLTPALDGFAPTREFPEIAEAQEMVATIEAGPHL
jgi:tetratricopeptide (TPR) repeat protein